MTIAPYGSWRSSISSSSLVDTTIGLSYPLVSGGTVAWTEARPSEQGRMVVVRRSADGDVDDVLPPGFSARTLVHEYGGLCTALTAVSLIFSNFADQRVWRIGPGEDPYPLTPEPDVRLGHRFADFSLTPDGSWIAAVRERHPGGATETATGVINDIVVFPADGSAPPVPVASGRDFFSAPRFSPDGRRMAWLAWDHPNMPWDGTQLFVAEIGPDRTLVGTRLVSGGADESISQPRWSPDGGLHFLSDRTGWWNLYEDDGAAGRPLFRLDAEFGGPDWVFGQSSYTFLAGGRLIVTWSEEGQGRIGELDRAGTGLRPIPIRFESFAGLVGEEDHVVAVAGSPVEGPAVVRIAIDDGSVTVLKAGRQTEIDPATISRPRSIAFPSSGGRTAHGLFYPPTNPDYQGPSGERPPLVVMSHGGPTSAAQSILDLVIQFFTSRGLAVVDVDYGGSTGYGRAYRKQLDGAWGVIDVDDCVAAALWLADRGEVDRGRLAIRGRSAGGYTTLAALTFRDTFAVGAVHYGVADAALLAVETHKFESRYLDGLIGPWPDAEARYRERSPIHHTEDLSCPVILFQGTDDKVVPLSQATAMAAALRDKGIPFALMTFEGEQHGFRQAETIMRVIESELWFYGRVLGFTVSDDIEPVPIENAGALRAG